MAENTLKITTNGNYKNIDITNMSNGDTIVIKKIFAETKKFEGMKDYNDGKGAKSWEIYSALVEYNGEKVSFVMPKIHSSEDKIIKSSELADVFNKTGGVDDSIRITCKKNMGKAAYDFKPKFEKDQDIVKVDFVFEKI